MVFKSDSRLGELLGKSKWIALLGVLVLYISSGMLVILGIVELYYIVFDLYTHLIKKQRVEMLFFSASFINIIEIYLLAIIFYIFAIGIYKLFVGKFTLLGWYKIDSLDEMKAELSKAIVVFLSVFILQKIVEWKEPLNLLYFGVAITLTCSNLIWYSRTLKNGKYDKNGNIQETGNNREPKRD